VHLVGFTCEDYTGMHGQQNVKFGLGSGLRTASRRSPFPI